MPTGDINEDRNQQHVEGLHNRRSIDGERLIAVFAGMVEPIGRSLPTTSEVVLHDLSLLPNSIVAIYGDVTGRRVGDPATDLLLEKVSNFSDDNMVGYETTLPDGRSIRSSTMVIRDVAGTAVAALCINSDLTVWNSAQQVIDAMLGIHDGDRSSYIFRGLHAESDVAAPQPQTETFAHNVDELAAHLIHTALSAAGVPVELMHKRHKIEVVRDLKSRGMFLLRDAVDMVADELSVTRFTIYNYLNEIADDGDQSTGEHDIRKKKNEK